MQGKLLPPCPPTGPRPLIQGGSPIRWRIRVVSLAEHQRNCAYHICHYLPIFFRFPSVSNCALEAQTAELFFGFGSKRSQGGTLHFRILGGQELFIVADEDLADRTRRISRSLTSSVLFLVASLLLVAMPKAPSSLLLLVVRPGAPFVASLDQSPKRKELSLVLFNPSLLQ